ncbi:hypothetical protein JTE90_010816 [Oedothorax gibbosus]|uniref:RRM domain-containing protein n=1 Tax=Oedothorax gibbosus TaxID=931172 RepID=A0AAV6V4F9_9ARAC|nr:hypothetical protein JTE90_010816 [Oedothorax gibbosus]
MALCQGGQPDADSIKMFVGQVPKNWDEGDLRNVFEEFGPVYQVCILRDKTSHQSRGKTSNIIFIDRLNAVIKC